MVKTHKKNDRDRVIINFGSVASTHSSSGMINYGASKGGVLGMTLPLARELGKFNIRVVCFTPGIFLTNMVDKLNQIALGRNGDSRELSQAVQGAIESSFLTGTFFHLDSTIASPHHL
ncbi:hypothetical protein IMG5_118350 [Ichthyophthirius multifiliis]|uniref:Uncharacterized protein n=1 Tax=Ichthyophthirius multifiliis TaxID=5932 RepID=G0QUP3_ICHMU|nr:hypothetical protein IMG5_118350 [Ichthyophthirius multifiliis]EGR31057.1 hypothetical protein IMG5_118350 [Ichthyophthirius multifiliis]|eukprot:XP_004034543.1 hypothetical protein IMG5_118350 [Ichthyophthirius multifiliis]